MLTFGVTIPATVPQGSDIPEGLMNYSVYMEERLCYKSSFYRLWVNGLQHEFENT
jgi:hypothetical protein